MKNTKEKPAEQESCLASGNQILLSMHLLLEGHFSFHIPFKHLFF